MPVNSKSRSSSTGQGMTSDYGAVFVQQGGANQPLVYLGCVGLSGLTRDKSAPEYQYCIDENGKYTVWSATYAPPAGTSFDLTIGLGKVRSQLDKMFRDKCVATYYVKHSDCGKRDDFCAANRWSTYPIASLNTLDEGDSVARTEQASIERTFSVTSPDVGEDVWRPAPIVYGAPDPAETTYSASGALSYIHIPKGYHSCGGGDCGAAKGSCDYMVAGNTSGSGTAGATNAPGILYSRNGGDTWTFLDFPIGGSEPYSGATFQLAVLLEGGNFVALGASATAFYAVYGIITDTTATVTSFTTIATGLTSAGTLRGVYTDGRAVWAMTLNRAYYSLDGGRTWTLAFTGGAGEVFYSIHFNGEDGYIAGADPTATLVYRTQNGGATWVEVSPAVSLGIAYGVHLTNNDVWLATATGLFYSRNDGATWTGRTLVGGGAVLDIDFYDDYIGVAVSGTRTFITVTGGADGTWCSLDLSGVTPNQIEFCEPDSFWVANAAGSLVKYEPKSL